MKKKIYSKYEILITPKAKIECLEEAVKLARNGDYIIIKKWKPKNSK